MTEAPPIRMSFRMMLREVARKAARKAFRVAKALDANIGPVRGPRAEPDGDSPTFRIRQALVTFRFVELLTRTPTPRPLRSSSWGYGFFADPSPGSSRVCTMPTTPGITNSRAANSREVRAQTDPASAPSPRPLAFPILELQVPVGSEPWQLRRLHHAHNPWRSQSSCCRFLSGPSDGSSGDCAIPDAPGDSRPRDAGPRGIPAAPGPAPALHPSTADRRAGPRPGLRDVHAAHLRDLPAAAASQGMGGAGRTPARRRRGRPQRLRLWPIRPGGPTCSRR